MKTNPVTSRFAVPVATALAAHVFLFFGFASPPPLSPPPTRLAVDVGRLVPPVPDEVQPPEAEQWDSNVQHRQVSSPTLTSEPLPALDLPSTFRVPLDAALSPATEKNLTVIPAGPPGPWQEGNSNFPGRMISRSLDLDNVPRAKFQARPDYPFSLRATGVSGEVVVDFLVDEQGRVSDIRVLSSTHRDFEESTLRAVAKWRFEPGKRNGRVVRFRMSQLLSFSVGES